MEFFRDLIKPKGSFYEQEFDRSNELIKNRILNSPGDFKPRFQGRIWMVCRCDAERCPGFRKNKILAKRLLRIIDFYQIREEMDQDFLSKIETGHDLEPKYLIFDEDSYEWSASRLISNQDTFQINRRLKFRQLGTIAKLKKSF